MQLTTQRLKQIIKEELESIVNEMNDEEILNEDLGSSVAVITALTYGIGALVATGAAVGTIDTLKSLVQSLRSKKGQPLKEAMEVAQALLAAVSALTAMGASVGIIDTLKSLADNYRGKGEAGPTQRSADESFDSKKMEEARKAKGKAAAMKGGKMPAKRGDGGMKKVGPEQTFSSAKSAMKTVKKGK